jgi:hypothetical protein
MKMTLPPTAKVHVKPFVEVHLALDVKVILIPPCIFH